MIVKTNKGDLPVRYGMSALAVYGDMTGKSMNEVKESLDKFGELKVSEVLAFIYSGFKDGARWAKEECKIEGIEEVGDMIDDDPDLFTRMLAVYNEGSEEGKGDKKK